MDTWVREPVGWEMAGSGQRSLFFFQPEAFLQGLPAEAGLDFVHGSGGPRREAVTPMSRTPSVSGIFWRRVMA